MPELLCLAESITKTLAICMRCGNPAKHSQRLVESGDLIVVGAAGMYEARCRRCFEPGAPHQDHLDFTGLKGASSEMPVSRKKSWKPGSFSKSPSNVY